MHMAARVHCQWRIIDTDHGKNNFYKIILDSGRVSPLFSPCLRRRCARWRQDTRLRRNNHISVISPRPPGRWKFSVALIWVLSHCYHETGAASSAEITRHWLRQCCCNSALSPPVIRGSTSVSGGRGV